VDCSQSSQLHLNIDKFLRPDRFDTYPSSPESSKQWFYWFRTFKRFLASISSHSQDELDVLINYIAPSVYGYIADCTTYNEAIQVLESTHIKPKNEKFARYTLATRRQEPGESLDQFLQSLKQLSNDCNIKAAQGEETCISCQDPVYLEYPARILYFLNILLGS
jgi:hypothetical protein